MKFTIATIAAFAALVAAAPPEDPGRPFYLPIPCGTGPPFRKPCLDILTTLQTTTATPTPTPTAPCTTTFYTAIPERHSVRVTYLSTLTATETVDCHGCEATTMDWRKNHHWGHGPVVFGNEVLEAKTVTEKVCAASPTM